MFFFYKLSANLWYIVKMYCHYILFSIKTDLLKHADDALISDLKSPLSLIAKAKVGIDSWVFIAQKQALLQLI